jgi:glycosyltransferase involved in cell wall biosynthesis
MSQVSTDSKPSASAPPPITVGLPVYNGQKYLAQAIESILGQTFPDFELIISDNASTDRTQEICLGYVARDPRVRYFRNERNLGAGPNYDLCFERARSKYFKWAAHDDLIAPDFLEKTKTKMDANSDAVLCCTGVTEIGPEDKVIRVYNNDRSRLESRRPSDRFAEMILTPHGCTDFFGLFRREALSGSELHGAYGGSDRVLLAEMALRGRFVQVLEPLFFNREHSERFTRAKFADRGHVGQWLGTSQSSRGQLYYWLTYKNYWFVVNKSVSDRDERLACYRHLLEWWLSDYNARDMANDLLWSISPALLDGVRKVKRAFVGERKPLLPGDLKSER